MFLTQYKLMSLNIIQLQSYKVSKSRLINVATKQQSLELFLYSFTFYHNLVVVVLKVCKWRES